MSLSFDPVCEKKIFVWDKGHWIIYVIFNNAVNWGVFRKTLVVLYIIFMLYYSIGAHILKTVSMGN